MYCYLRKTGNPAYPGTCASLPQCFQCANEYAEGSAPPNYPLPVRPMCFGWTVELRLNRWTLIIWDGDDIVAKWES